MNLIQLAAIYTSVKALAPASKRTYEQAANDVGNPELAELTQDWVYALRGRFNAAGTWNARLGQMRALIRFAFAQNYLEGYVDEHPIFQVRRELGQARPRRAVEPQAFLAAIEMVNQSSNKVPGYFWAAVLVTLYYTGMRRKQLVHLAWQDIDFARKVILLRSEGSKTMNEHLIPMHPKVEEHLLRLRGVVFAVAPYAGANQVFHYGAVLTPPTNQPLIEGQVTTRFNNLQRQTGLQITAHQMRHTFATRVMAGTRNIKTVQMLLTHSRPDTTARYIHPSDTDLRFVINQPVDGFNPKPVREKIARKKKPK